MNGLQIALIFSAFAFVGAMILRLRSQCYAENICGIAFHLGMLPIVAAFPTNPMATAAGYFWIFMDTLIGGASINGLDEKTAWALRMGVHVSAGFWIVNVALLQNPWPMTFGLLAGITLTAYSLLSPFIPRNFIVINMPLMVIWLLLTAWG